MIHAGRCPHNFGGNSLGGESGTRWVKVGDPPVVFVDHFQVNPIQPVNFHGFSVAIFCGKNTENTNGTVPWEIAGIEILFIWSQWVLTQAITRYHQISPHLPFFTSISVGFFTILPDITHIPAMNLHFCG